MANSSDHDQKVLERTVRELMNLGFEEEKARQAVSSIGDPSDANLAMNWLFDHGEEDKGGAVKFEHCPHVDEMGFQCLVKRSQLSFGKPCVQGCRGEENWLCLMCNESRCGRYGNRHSLQHWQKTKKEGEKQITIADAAAGQVSRGHCLALSYSDLSVWCYECDCYVQHESLDPLVKTMERLKFGGESTADGPQSASLPAQKPLLAAGSKIPCGPDSAHGLLGDSSWAMPTLARACDDAARPGYKTMLAHEYLDEPEVLQAKVRKLADLVRRSRQCIAYTGAGISTASGISDYATKAGNSVANASKKLSPWEAQPTLAHRVLVAMYNAGHLKHWVQQNHDGLPQKAGFPQQEINEIHGAWYDPSNPVVPMTGTLRQDLIERMLDWEDRTDLCLSLGTSMVGMNADRMAVSPAERAKRGQTGALGTVIVTLQQTQFDSLASLRIFARIDDVMDLLAKELALSVPTAPKPRPWTRPVVGSLVGSLDPWMSGGPVLRDLPYDKNGRASDHHRLTLDLTIGQKFRVVDQPAWDAEAHGNICQVVEGTEAMVQEGHVALRFGEPGRKSSITRVLGRWWLDAAIEGKAEKLPIVPFE